LTGLLQDCHLLPDLLQLRSASVLHIQFCKSSSGYSQNWSATELQDCQPSLCFLRAYNGTGIQHVLYGAYADLLRVFCMADLKQAFCRCFAGLSRLSYCKTGLLQFFHDTKSSAGLLEDCSSAVFLQIVGLKNIQHQLACYTDFVYIWLACCAFDWNDRPTENRLISMHKIENERTLIGTSRQTLQHTL